MLPFLATNAEGTRQEDPERQKIFEVKVNKPTRIFQSIPRNEMKQTPQRVILQ